MNAIIRLAFALALMAFVSPDTLLAAPPHTGQVIHDGFELSDLALGLCAAAGVWFARRSMRARAAARKAAPDLVRFERNRETLEALLVNRFSTSLETNGYGWVMEDAFDILEATVRARMVADPGQSYVAKLAAKGRAAIAQKVGEEAVETVIAAMADDRVGLISESTDLIFHLVVLLNHAGLSLDDIRAEMTRREGVSGLAEKAGR